jgi:hypothetical protein
LSNACEIAFASSLKTFPKFTSLVKLLAELTFHPVAQRALQLNGASTGASLVVNMQDSLNTHTATKKIS